jgi:hypothetical protein
VNFDLLLSTVAGLGYGELESLKAVYKYFVKQHPYAWSAIEKEYSVLNVMVLGRVHTEVQLARARPGPMLSTELIPAG